MEGRSMQGEAKRLGRVTGLLWIATFVTSIPAVLLYDPLLNNRAFILGAAATGGSSSARRSSCC
jgi:hypothetical protein